ncbi:MAG TPA: hypothetical protein VHJ82_02475 [Actinomycetota bacterium]|nr:hypothetical protein [Actinomycetota bacterium]
MLERAWSFALRNLATLFLTYALVATPIQVVYSYAFKDVLAVREIHSEIETFPQFREVRGVGRADLTRARLGLVVVTILELLLVPLAYGATRRIREVEERGDPPEVLDAWRHARTLLGDFTSRLRVAPGPLLLAAGVGTLIGWLTWRVGQIVIDPLGPDQTFAGYALVASTARSLGVAFWLSAVAFAGSRGHRPANRSSSGTSEETVDSTRV